MKKVFCFLLAFGALLMTGCARGEARLWAVGVGKGDAILIQRYVLGLFSGNTYGIGEYIS